MRYQKAAFLCAVPLLLSGLAARAEADAREAGPAADQALDAALSSEDKSRQGGEHTALPAGAGRGYRPITGKERWGHFRDALWGPGIWFRAAGPALGAHLKNDPPVWGQGAEGYGKRFANRFGRAALQQTYEAAGAAALGHEVRYVRSRRAGFLPRAAHALAANLVTYDRNGRRAPHIARVGSVFAAQFTGNLWMPAGHRGASAAIRGAGVELGAGSAFNLIREFAPELKRIFARR